MGNRGMLHDESQHVMREWKRKPWVTCLLSFNGIKRVPFSPNAYSELFFLDEATAMAAGHRPCATCQRERYALFKDLWCRANPSSSGRQFMPIAAIDDATHRDRVDRRGAKVTFDARLSELPAGTIFQHGDRPYLLHAGQCFPWSFEGYGPHTDIAGDTRVRVLTPSSFVRMFDAGFVPSIHHSAGP